MIDLLIAIGIVVITIMVFPWVIAVVVAYYGWANDKIERFMRGKDQQ